MTENEKARELIATSETTVMVDDSLYDAALDAFDEYDIEYEEV